MHARRLTPLLCGLLLMLAVPVIADHDDSTVGQPPSWDANLTYLGTFAGNDKEATVGAIVGFDVMQVEKVDTPATSSGSLTISCTGGCGNSQSGTWSYTGMSVIEFLVIKGGPNFALYQINNGVTSGNWDTGDVLTGSGTNHPGLSHLTLYKEDTVLPVDQQPWGLVKQYYR